MRLDEAYNRIAGELLAEERPHHRKADGTTDHEAAARAVVERIALEYPQFDDYQRSECAVYVNVSRSKRIESSAKGTATARGNGSKGISEEERSRDMRLFVYVQGVGYVYMADAYVGQVKLEIARRREHAAAEREAISQLEWSVEIAGRLGAKDSDRMGDYVDFG
jgi:hypothetical protein